ncbi:MAG: M28 family peptidase [Rhodothermales bacterium]
MKRFLQIALFALLVGPLAVMAQDTDVRQPIASPPSPTPTLFDDPAVVNAFAETITAEDLAAHLYFFASDFFEGRETSARGQKLAAQYLASQYRKIGLEPRGTAGTDNPRDPAAYMQPFTVYGSKFKQAGLVARTGDGPLASATYGGSNSDGHLMLQFGSGEDVSGGLIFGGYGIADDELGYNDMSALAAANLDLTQNWLLILAGEPMDASGKSLLTTDGEPSRWTTGRFTKFSSMGQTGMPKGILVVSPDAATPLAERVAVAATAPAGVGGLSLTPPDPNASGSRRRSFPPVFEISVELANQLLSPAGTTVEALQNGITASLEPTVLEVPGLTLNGNVENDAFEAQTENVVAYLEGSDLKDELVVVTSHYDHIGFSGTGEDRINNGADDDGSGTVTILEIAEAFMAAKKQGYGPRRSVLFMNVTGEEKGLLGSAWYTDHEPIFPLEKTVTNLNIDMIGRIDPTHPGPDGDYVYLIGSNLISQELHDINVKTNEVMGTDLDLNERFNSKDDPNQFYRRSDHWNFGKHNIPFIFFFTGTHDDYHGVDDEPDKIEYERMERIARLIFGTAWQVANQDNPPAVTGEGFN